MSYKVGVKTPGDVDWVFNAIRFKTEAAARRYGEDLFRRWTEVQKWEVFVSDDPVTYEGT